jgi:outer membrane receptor protein involved in Fe transport
MAVAAVDRLVATAALRHEHYTEFGDVTTPKLGLEYEPIHGVAIKGSWGRSFKAPTLYQQLTPPSLDLYPATFFGATGYPDMASVLFVNGVLGKLRPERAQTWTATLALKPDFLPGFSIEATYFDINYRDRILQPLDGQFGLLFPDSAYQQFLVRDPSASAQAALIASAPGGIDHNDSGYAYDPANVIGIAYNNYQNVSRDHADGVDVDGSYEFAAFRGKMTINGAASWLDSDRQLVPGNASVPISGYVYAAPKFRGRGGVAWNGGRVSAAANVNYIGKIIDNQETPTLRQRGFTTIDATLRYHWGEGHGLLSGLEIGIVSSNLFNERPPLRTPLADYVVNFDSTNYNAIGRTVSATLTKHW